VAQYQQIIGGRMSDLEDLRNGSWDELKEGNDLTANHELLARFPELWEQLDTNIPEAFDRIERLQSTRNPVDARPQDPGEEVIGDQNGFDIGEHLRITFLSSILGTFSKNTADKLVMHSHDPVSDQRHLRNHHSSVSD
jgi:hypothetical protein